MIKSFLLKSSILLSTFFIIYSCSKNRFEIDTDKIDLQLTIERFDRDLMSMDTALMDDEIIKMKQKYGTFFNRFATNVIMLGSPDSTQFEQRLKAFVTDSTLHEIYIEGQHVFSDVSAIEDELTVAFKYVKYHFPELKIPRVAMHISGFNQSIVATEDVLSISIDNYLGSDYILYKGLMYDYQLPNMEPSKVAPDLVLGFLMSEFPSLSYGTLLNCILSRGKILYLQSIFMPERNESDIMGYTAEQLEWCQVNEKVMWNYLIENKQLYNTSHMVLTKYLNSAPFTSYFTQDSPGQAAIWLGLQIVKSYMDNNDITLEQLMQNTDYQTILADSKYRP